MTREKLQVGKLIVVTILVGERKGVMKGCGRDLHVSLSGASDAKNTRRNGG